MNTTFIVGAVVYTGPQSKLFMNSQAVPLKDSTLMKLTNVQIIFLFLTLICISLFSAFWAELEGDLPAYIGRPKQGLFRNFLTFVILLNNLIPISLQFTLEFVKLGQALFIKKDQAMLYNGTYADARTSNLNEELGQIKYVFSDKTGTLTQNIMMFRWCGISGKKYSEMDKEALRKSHNSDPLIKDFLTIMSICHTVIPEKDEKTGKIEYNASSPDEKAFVDAAKNYGFEFLGRTPDSINLKDWNDTNLTYDILAIIDFTSARKRMSVIAKTPTGEIKLFCKGADNVILEKISAKQLRQVKQAQQQIDEFARDGLRTMAFAVRTITQADYNVWETKWKKATVQIENRNEELDKAAVLIEKGKCYNINQLSLMK